jgi:hypothetical protein
MPPAGEVLPPGGSASPRNHQPANTRISPRATAAPIVGHFRPDALRGFAATCDRPVADGRTAVAAGRKCGRGAEIAMGAGGTASARCPPEEPTPGTGPRGGAAGAA